jgi:hypothetical protein
MDAKVDITKLQMLNDRINQTIDALNQVRMSVHGLQPMVAQPVQQLGVGAPVAWGGLSHSAQVPGAVGIAGLVPSIYGYGLGAYVPSSFAQPVTYGQVPVSSGIFGGSGLGLSHTGVGVGGLGVEPFYFTRVQQTFPFVQQPELSGRLF